MRHSQFIESLKSLDKKEIKAFNKFVASPYFNTSAATKEMLDEIMKFYPDFKLPEFNDRVLFKRIYFDRHFSPTLFRKLISNLNKLFCEYLTVANNPYPDYSLQHGLREKKLYTLLSSHNNKIHKRTQSDRIGDHEFRCQIFFNEELLNYYYCVDDAFRYEAGKMTVYEYDTLLYFYRLTLFCMRQTNVIVERKPDALDYVMNSIDIEKLYNEIDSAPFRNKKKLKFLLSLILLLQKNDEKLYREIKDFTFSYSESFNDSFVFIGFHYLYKFINYMINTGDVGYNREKLEVLKKQERVYHNKSAVPLAYVDFDNFMKSAIFNCDFQWAKYLITEYLPSLEEKGNPGLSKYFNALILFHEKQYDKALDTLAEFNTSKFLLDNFFLTRDLRTLILQIYFELRFIDEAYYSIDSFNHYLKNNKKVNPDNRLSYGNFVKYYKELVNAVSKEDASGLFGLKKIIEHEKIINKSWLLEKIDEISSV